MKMIKPFSGLRPKPEYAAKTFAPPYDIVDTQTARELANNNPYSFLHLSKPEIDCDQNIDPYDESVYQTGALNFSKLLAESILIEDPTNHFYIYQINSPQHTQTGLVTLVSTEAYKTNHVRQHEHTRPKKETDRVRLLQTIEAHISPVMLTFRDNVACRQLLSEFTQSEPAYDINNHDGYQHRFWHVEKSNHIEKIQQTFDTLSTLYIADGHHRVAAATVAGEDYFLAALFPDNELQILPYHRLVNGLNGLSIDAFLLKLSENFDVRKVSAACQPTEQHHFGMYLNNQWYEVIYRSTSDKDTSSMDIDILHQHIIEPILAISDPRSDPRIDFLGGQQSLERIQKTIDNATMTVAFTLIPTTIQQLETMSDKNQVMPPKSTWFEPKLADGLIAYRPRR